MSKKEKERKRENNKKQLKKERGKNREVEAQKNKKTLFSMGNKVSLCWFVFCVLLI